MGRGPWSLFPQEQSWGVPSSAPAVLSLPVLPRDMRQPKQGLTLFSLPIFLFFVCVCVENTEQNNTNHYVKSCFLQ